MFRGKRAFLADLFFHSGAYRAFRHFEPRSLVIFNYHRIRSGEGQSPIFDDGVFGPDPETLRAQFASFKRNADVISEADLIEHVHGRRRLPKTCVMVTFDDGYRDNAELALPVIREQGIPAIFFIPTQAIEEREMGWWDTIAYLMKKTASSELFLRGRRFDLSKGRGAVITELQGWMKTLKSDQTTSLVAEISHACQVPFPDEETRSRELMTWKQIREAADNGVTIGSHTHSHRVLSTLSLSDQLEEFRISKRILERELGQPVRSIAYPNGRTSDFHAETGLMAERAGYELGFSFHTGANRLDGFRRFAVGRISAEETPSLNCAAIALPTIFARSRCAREPMSASVIS